MPRAAVAREGRARPRAADAHAGTMSAAGAVPGRSRRRRLRAVVVLLACAAHATRAASQELDPRAYVSVPVGTNIAVFGYNRSDGGVTTDPSLPLDDVSATMHSVMVGYSRTFAAFGRQAGIFGSVPYAWGSASGRINETVREASRSGLADARVRLSLLVRGGPALRPRAYVQRQRGERPTIVGASLLVVAPTGQYYPEKLVNLGANRWAFKPEIAVSHPAGHWLFDVYGAVWLFTKNPGFYPGDVDRGQDPIGAVQGHVSYNLGLRSWAALDATWYAGGRSALNGSPKADQQNNTRMGATVSFPVASRYSLKAAYYWPLTTEKGSSFHAVSLAWQMPWLTGGVR